MFEAREFARDVGRVRVQRGRQLADIDTRRAVNVEERQQLAAEPGTEREHCSDIILHMRYIYTAKLRLNPELPDCLQAILKVWGRLRSIR